MTTAATAAQPTTPANPNAGTAIVPWEEFTEDQATQIEAEASKGSTAFWKPGQGDNIIRGLPAPAGSHRPIIVSTQQHYLELPKKDKPTEKRTVSFNCARRMIHGRCYLCDLADKYMTTGDPVDYEKGKACLPKARLYMNIVDRTSQAAVEKGIQVWAFSRGMSDDLTMLRKNKNLGGNWGDPSGTGFDLVIHREGTTRDDTKYTVGVARQPSVLVADMAQLIEFLKAAPDLKRYEACLPYDVQVAKVKGDDTRSGTPSAPPAGTPPPTPPMPRAPAAAASSTVEDHAVSTPGDDDDIPF